MKDIKDEWIPTWDNEKYIKRLTAFANANKLREPLPITENISKVDVLELNGVRYVPEATVMELMNKSAIAFGEWLRKFTPKEPDIPEWKWKINTFPNVFEQMSTEEAFQIYNHKI